MSSDHVVTEWADEPRPSSNILRLIYQGRFLHGNVTLAGTFFVFLQYHTYIEVLHCSLRGFNIFCIVLIMNIDTCLRCLISMLFVKRQMNGTVNNV